ncbi:MAG: CheR family methyltransferase [Bacteroidia bacterium]
MDWLAVEPPPELPEQEVQELLTLLWEKHQYDFRAYAPASLRRRLAFILRKHGLKQVHQLIRHLEHNPDFIEQFISDLTVSTTELFRDPSFFRYLYEKIFPEFAPYRQILLWQAGVSTGEEVLSVAILLRELDLYSKVHIIATDIDKKALRSAQSLLYPKRYWELFSKNLKQVLPHRSLEMYATLEGDYIRFDASLIENVEYRVHNLVSDEPFGRFDMIICRNVMIYFSPGLQDRICDLFLRSLRIGGVLAIGAKESLLWCRNATKFVAVSEYERIYRRVYT